MHNYLLKKMLGIGILVLFIGVIIAPSISSLNNQFKNINTSTGMVSFNPFKEGWKYRKKITVDNTQVAGDLVNFPVLVNTIDSDLRDKAQSDGDDILFMDDKGKANQLYHEIESYVSFNGELVAWVNIPNLTPDTIFYIYYGNPDCGNQQNILETWNINFQAVYHMNDEGNGISDSTINNRNSTGQNSTPIYHQTGISGYSIYFDGVDDEIFLPHNFNLGSSDITLEVWIKAIAWPDYGGSCCALSFVGEHYLRSANYRNKYGEDELRGFGYCIAPYGGWVNLIVQYSPPVDEWIYIACTYDNDVGSKAFYNAELKASSSIIGNLRPRSVTSRIGYYFNGLIDEVRVSNFNFSDNWIDTTYNTINDSSNFLTFGQEERTRQKVYDNIMFQRLLERFPNMEVFLRIMNLLR